MTIVSDFGVFSKFPSWPPALLLPRGLRKQEGRPFYLYKLMGLVQLKSYKRVYFIITYRAAESSLFRRGCKSVSGYGRRPTLCISRSACRRQVTLASRPLQLLFREAFCPHQPLEGSLSYSPQAFL